MQAMLFAAGLGTRLLPLTATRPKALVEVCGRPLVARALDHLAQHNCQRVVVNVHHFAQMVEEYLRDHAAQWPMEILVSDERELLMDTGGGLAQALPLFDSEKPIVVCNADVVSDIDLTALLQRHLSSGAEATLLTSQRHSTRHLLFDDKGQLSGWHNDTSGETLLPRDVPTPYAEAFNAFHVVEPILVREMLPAEPKPIIPEYLRLCQSHTILRHPTPTGALWYDVGTPEKLKAATLGIRD